MQLFPGSLVSAVPVPRAVHMLRAKDGLDGQLRRQVRNKVRSRGTDMTPSDPAKLYQYVNSGRGWVSSNAVYRVSRAKLGDKLAKSG